MEGICAAFMTKWGKIPLLDTYRQMAIRQQKNQDWQACIWWAERGLTLYGQGAAREAAVEDLIKRRNRAITKLEEAVRPKSQVRLERRHATAVAETPMENTPAPVGQAGELEVLVCQQCNCRFERMRVRGRKPALCPTCRTTAKA
jgi:hypothetical protein